MASFVGRSRAIERHCLNNPFPLMMDSRVDHIEGGKGTYQERAWSTGPNLHYGCVQQLGRVSAHQPHYCSQGAILQGPCAKVADRKVIHEKAGYVPQGRRRSHYRKGLSYIGVEICTMDRVRTRKSSESEPRTARRLALENLERRNGARACEKDRLRGW
jgi:hypothetical protein